MLDIPECVSLYFDGQADHEALLVVGQAKTFPRSMTWDDLDTYVQARQINQDVQHAYWLVVKQAWHETWGACLKSHLPDAVPLNLEDYEADIPSVDYVWSNRLLLNYVTVPNSQSTGQTTGKSIGQSQNRTTGHTMSDPFPLTLCTGIRLARDGTLALCFGLDDGHEDWLAGTRLSLPSDLWSSPFSNWERRSKASLNITPKTGLPKLDAFAGAMDAALNAIKSARARPLTSTP